MPYRIPTKLPGVYTRVSEERMHKGRPDVCFDITYKVEGRKVWEKVGWASEGYSAKLAGEIRSERLRKVRHGEQLPREKKKAPLFKDVAERYLEWAKENKTRAGADDRSRYESYLKRFDDKRLNEITSFDLERLKSDLFKQGLRPATVRHGLVLFRQMVNKAIAWGMWKGDNPIKGVKLPTLQNQKERFLSHEEAGILLTELKKTSLQLHDMALLSLHCGLRAGEIFNLRGHDLDFENGMVHIGDPKNQVARKAFTTEAVREMLATRKPKNPEDLVFNDRRHGEKIKIISHAFRKVVDTIGFNKGITDPRRQVTFHSLRHTFASWLALQGETLLTIKELLGHRSLTMTQRYAHLAPDQKRLAALRLEEAFETKRNGKKEENLLNSSQ